MHLVVGGTMREFQTKCVSKHFQYPPAESSNNLRRWPACFQTRNFTFMENIGVQNIQGSADGDPQFH
jgi:hypothetical protein